MAKVGILHIKKLVEALVDYAGAELTLRTTEGFANEAFINRCFATDDSDEGISYLDIAKNLFLRTVSDSRKLEIRLLFDRDRAMLPTIHVREPSKQKGNSDGIGNISEELYLNDFRQDEYDKDIFPRTYQHGVRRSFNSQFELLITSANRHEVLVIEEVLMALLMGSQDTISLLLPFHTTQLSVKELIFNGDISPNLFIKAITLNVQYEKEYPEIVMNDLFSQILFEHQLYTK